MVQETVLTAFRWPQTAPCRETTTPGVVTNNGNYCTAVSHDLIYKLFHPYYISYNRYNHLSSKADMLALIL